MSRTIKGARKMKGFSRTVMIRSQADFEKVLAKANEKLVFVEFYATWSQACKQISPYIAQLGNTSAHPEYKSVVFCKVDADTAKEVIEAQKVSTVPCYQCWRKGEMVEEVSGAMPQKIIEMLERQRKAGERKPFFLFRIPGLRVGMVAGLVWWGVRVYRREWPKGAEERRLEKLIASLNAEVRRDELNIAPFDDWYAKQKATRGGAGEQQVRLNESDQKREKQLRAKMAEYKGYLSKAKSQLEEAKQARLDGNHWELFDGMEVFCPGEETEQYKKNVRKRKMMMKGQ